MNILARALLVTTLASVSWSVSAIEINENWSLNLNPALVSDYRSFGVSLSRRQPALQLDASLMHSSGLLVGIWGSNVDFGGDTRLEEGYYAGYYHQFAPGVDVFASIGRYEYPKESFINTNEFVGIVNYDAFRLGWVYDFDVKDTPNADFKYIGYTVPLPQEYSLYFQYGYNDINFDIFGQNGDSRQTYSDWQVKLSKPLWGAVWSAAYIDSDLSKSECSYYTGDDKTCSPTVVLGVTKSF